MSSSEEVMYLFNKQANRLISVLCSHIHRHKGPVLPQHGMSLPGASEKHGSVGFLVRDGETKDFHEHVRGVVYSSPFLLLLTFHCNHATVVLYTIYIVTLQTTLMEPNNWDGREDLLTKQGIYPSIVALLQSNGCSSMNPNGLFL